MRTGHQIPSGEFLPKLREVYVHAVNKPEPWRAVRWGSEELQTVRLRVMGEIVKDWRSVLDVGSGRGEFQNYVDHSVEYLGIDLVREFIFAARRIFPARKFEHHDLREGPRPADAVIASGTFTICNDEIFWSMLDAMWDSARHVMAFNCKSTWAPEDCASAGGISYLRDPAETLTACRGRYTRNLVLRHDYLDHDFTIAAYK